MKAVFTLLCLAMAVAMLLMTVMVKGQTGRLEALEMKYHAAVTELAIIEQYIQDRDGTQWIAYYSAMEDLRRLEREAKNETGDSLQ